MSWNYRVLQHLDHDGDPYYEIHEVYYSKDGAIEGWTANSVGPAGSDPQELEKDIKLLKVALTRPILKAVVDGERELLVEVEVGGVPSSDNVKPRRPSRLKGKITGEFLGGK
ncbi:MAG: hypothetical protein KBT72_00185 [Zhongshania sp.]|jgi:hypothetical protein|nr:hypothetical protein [Zhongshania sp.]